MTVFLSNSSCGWLIQHTQMLQTRHCASSIHGIYLKYNLQSLLVVKIPALFGNGAVCNPPAACLMEW